MDDEQYLFNSAGEQWVSYDGQNWTRVTMTEPFNAPPPDPGWDVSDGL